MPATTRLLLTVFGSHKSLYMEKEDQKWATLIWKDCLQKSIKTLTLGIMLSSISTVEKGTEFYCHNSMFQGKVKIQHQDWNNSFQVTVTPDDESEDSITTEDVSLQNVVYVIEDSIKHYHDCKNAEVEELRVAI